MYLSWAVRNRSDLIRVPEYKPGREKATRVELRSPDPSCNPYLAFAVMLAAGLKGIEEEYECPPMVEENIYDMTEDEREKLGIRSLPPSLEAAIVLCEQSELVREALGPLVHDKLLDNKRIEWDRYRTQVTSWELETYLPIL